VSDPRTDFFLSEADSTAASFAACVCLWCCFGITPERSQAAAGEDGVMHDRINDQRAYVDRIMAFRQTVSDYDEVVDAATTVIPRHVADFIKSSPCGPALGYFLVKNLETCRRIVWMPRDPAARALKRLESRLHAPRLALVHNIDAAAGITARK
jgi:hypothetical protein